jgi:gas vesicle protein
MSSLSDNAVSYGVGLLGGVVAGVLIGVLFAPKSGEEMRKDLMEVTDKLCSENDALSKCKDSSIDLVNRTKYTVEKQLNKVLEAVRAGKMAAAKRREELDAGYNY